MTILLPLSYQTHKEIKRQNTKKESVGLHSTAAAAVAAARKSTSAYFELTFKSFDLFLNSNITAQRTER